MWQRHEVLVEEVEEVEEVEREIGIGKGVMYITL